MQDDKPGRVSVRRQERLHGALEVFVLENLGWKVERVVVLGGVKSLTHGCGIVAHFEHLVEDSGHGAVHGKNHGPHVFHGLNLRRDLRDHLWHEAIHLAQVAQEDAYLLAELVDSVQCIEYRSERPTDRNSVAVLFPVEIASNWSPEIIKIRDVVA
ncbi:hypothetical protein CAB90_00513 [Mycobacterium tuberculosis]|uniref:Uncharacterized protein n=1 Tax=Mycobacterium tuberculosis TaxID=1773 RepID=A0A2I7W3Y5_MYCTX|nr:hypothetical protein CAB90_00513 [Mycobacterium tuberculosis]